MAHLLVRGITVNRLLFTRAGLFRKAAAPTGGSQLSSNPVHNTVIKRNFLDSFYQNRLLRQTQQQQSGSAAATRMPGWLGKFLGDKPTYSRYSKGWWWDKTVVCVVFAITGSTTAYFVRPFVEQVLHLDGSLWEGPWSYRVAYLVTITPIYSFLLVLVGTIFGRHAFFKKFAKRMWTRMIPRF